MAKPKPRRRQKRGLGASPARQGLPASASKPAKASRSKRAVLHLLARARSPVPAKTPPRFCFAEVNRVSARLKGVACPGACSLMSISFESMQNSREHGDMLIKVIAVL